MATILFLLIMCCGALFLGLYNVAFMWFVYGLWPNWSTWFLFIVLAIIISVVKVVFDAD